MNQPLEILNRPLLRVLMCVWFLIGDRIVNQFAAAVNRGRRPAAKGGSLRLNSIAYRCDDLSMLADFAVSLVCWGHAVLRMASVCKYIAIGLGRNKFSKKSGGKGVSEYFRIQANLPAVGVRLGRVSQCSI
jgi:hypothetical protein